MDSRLIVTMVYIAHLFVGGMFVLSYQLADVPFADRQFEFLILVGYLGPTLALGLTWVRNYRLGSPMFAGTMAVTAWFVTYFFFIYSGTGSVWTAEGGAFVAYAVSGLTVVIVSTAGAIVGTWIWYREHEPFRAAVRRTVLPNERTK